MSIHRYAADWPARYAQCTPVPLDQVDIGGFLGKYIDQNIESVLVAMESELPAAFRASASGNELKSEWMRLAADSDVYKWLEGACYVFARTRDAKLKSSIDELVSLILACQRDDGYINTQVPPRERFDSAVNHDLYIAGHFFEAAVAHARATSQTELLQGACRWADFLISEYNNDNPYFSTVGRREHSEYELGFLRLYRETGNAEYLNFALILAKMTSVGPKVADIKAGDGDLHAVRVGYLLAGLADLYMETGGEELFRFLSDLWHELRETRSYVTGAVCSHGELISTEPFDLPHTQDHPDRTTGETCYSIAMVLFTWRMFSVFGDRELTVD